ncbi:SAM-dependent DNA methyltransferase [Kaistia sp. MMO-174]|uniref:SAM-dependent DNA methyltransferase n=1 Tax=Kaistia sp. MMO-174 TaxID=3081256 RepID=UPI00301B339D
MIPSGATAVMSARKSPKRKKAGLKSKPLPCPVDKDPREGLEFFPTPPWATRALTRYVLPLVSAELGEQSYWEPCCGEGHQAEVLNESFGHGYASDVYPHGYGAVGSFVGADGFDLDIARCPFRPDWVITNPPFGLAVEVVERALEEAIEGVAILVRTLWIESDERYQLFSRYQPTLQATFAERVPMVQYRWDPVASTATSYSWIIWRKPFVGCGHGGMPSWRTVIIPPVCRQELSRPDDVARFTGRQSVPLLSFAEVAA